VVARNIGNENDIVFHVPTMPRNKEALIRYRIINRLLLEKKSVTMEEMKEACERALDRAPLGLRTLRTREEQGGRNLRPPSEPEILPLSALCFY
jgi:hypothetical protein